MNGITIQKFMDYLEKDKGCSARTISSYYSDLILFDRFIKKNFKDCQEEDIILYKHDLVRLNLTHATVNRRLSVLRSYYAYLIKTKEISQNPALLVDKLKLPKKIPIILNENQSTMLLDCILMKGMYSVRDYAIFCTFLLTGCRVSELVNLRVNDIDFSNNVIYIRNGKGNKDRMIPMISKLSEAINTYLSNGTVLTNEKRPKPIKYKCGRGYFLKEQTYEHLFITKFCAPFSSKGVEYLFKQYCSVVGIEQKGLSLHALRRSCLTYLYKQGVDLFVLKEISGHARLQTLEHYLAVDHSKVNEAMQKHPLSSRGMDSNLMDLIRNN